ncbi:MAG: phosphoglycerate dehydrogenase [Armatimonadota bacterium]
MMNKILVTPRSLTKSGHPSLDRLKDVGYEIVFSAPGQQPTEGDLVELLPGCVGYLAGVETISKRALESARALKVISRNGTGVDNIDLDAANSQGITICRAEGANARGVAELAITLLLALARSIPFSDCAIKANGWQRRQGMELEGRTLGLVGCGKIGSLVASFGLAFGMKVAAYDIYQDERLKQLPGFSYQPLDEVLSGSDSISLHCPPSKDGKPLIDDDAIGRMKLGVHIINTARAGLVDESAITRGIESGIIAGFATDVFECEPPVERELLMSDRVIATPHIGGFTAESVSRAVSVAVDNLLEHLKQGGIKG